MLLMDKLKIDEATAILMAIAWVLVKRGIPPEDFVEKLVCICHMYEVDQERISNVWMAAIQKALLLKQSGELN
jgi:hypothetical protein